jgi:phospholipid/cholesterol/gamma-HCH transport system ATP-binding protein
MPSASEPGRASPAAHVTVEDLSIAYGEHVLMRGIDFAVRRGDVFTIMGGSGSGKTTLMRAMVGLKAPASGAVRYHGEAGEGESFWQASPEARQRLTRRFGVLYQQGALWSSMTLGENVALPLGEYTDLGAGEIRELVALKLALVGLAGFEDYFPAEISGGMRKRAALARAIALDPEVLYFDEPSAGLDPLSSRHLDELILELRDSLGATVIMVTHELPSILSIATNSVFLDGETGTQLAAGDPKRLLEDPPDPKIRAFLTRGEHEEQRPR